MPRPDPPIQEQLSPEEQRRVTRAALLRPMHLLVAAIGIAFFAMTLMWWVLPLTLVTYLALVYLAASSPLFKRLILRGRDSLSGTAPPEQRIHRLPNGETRRKVEAALTARDRALVAIENSGEATRGLLQDAPPKLNLLLERLIDVSEKREQVAATVRPPETTPDGPRRETRNITPEREVERELRLMDAQLSDAFEKVSALRPRVVHISTEIGDDAREAADRLLTDLDETLRHLDALLSRTFFR